MSAAPPADSPAQGEGSATPDPSAAAAATATASGSAAASATAAAAATAAARKSRLAAQLDASLIIDGGEDGRRVKRARISDGTGAAGEGAGAGAGETPEQKAERVARGRQEARSVGERIYNGLMEARDDEGHLVASPFIKLPNKRQLPDYYTVIKHPQSLELIHAKLAQTTSTAIAPLPSADGKVGGYEGYDTLEQVKHDFDTVFNNAKRYNVKESQIFVDARMLHKLVKKIYEEHKTPGGGGAEGGERGGSGSPEPEANSGAGAEGKTDAKADAEMKAVMDAEDDEEDAEEDDPMGEGEGEGAADAAATEAQQRRRVSSSQPASASGAEGRAGPGSTGGAAHGDRRGPRGPYQRHGPSVYKLTKMGSMLVDRAKTADGRRVADIFDDLPDRREYQDYYVVITQPISMAEINNKVGKRSYNNINEWTADVNLMCDNAMRYNVEGSGVYNDAVFLKNYLYSKILPALKTRSLELEERARIRSAGGDPGPSVTPFSEIASPSRPSPHQVPPRLEPRLPPNTVTPDIVRSLGDYPEAEKTAWAASMSNANAAKLAEMMRASGAAARAAEIAASTPVVYPPAMPPRQISLPPITTPLIRYIAFSYDVPEPSEFITKRKTIKLRNIRGVVSHNVAVGARTPSVILVAYLDESFSPERKTDGTVAESLQRAPLPEISLRVDNRQTIPGMFVYPNDDYTQRPSGCRWDVPIPVETPSAQIFITTSKRDPLLKDGRHSDTTVIIVGRQLP